MRNAAQCQDRNQGSDGACPWPPQALRVTRGRRYTACLSAGLRHAPLRPGLCLSLQDDELARLHVVFFAVGGFNLDVGSIYGRHLNIVPTSATVWLDKQII